MAVVAGFLDADALTSRDSSATTTMRGHLATIRFVTYFSEKFHNFTTNGTLF
jgi:hypothetical protein